MINYRNYDVDGELVKGLPGRPAELIAYLEADPRRVFYLAGEWLEVFRDCGVEPARHIRAGGGFILATFALIKWAKAKGFEAIPLLTLKEELVFFQTDCDMPPGSRPDAVRMAAVWEKARRVVRGILEDAEISMRPHSAPPAAGRGDGLGTLGKDDLTILKILHDENRAMTFYDIEAASAGRKYSNPLSRKTIGKHLTDLRSKGLTMRPGGKRGGECITPKGREALPKKSKRK